MSGPTLHPQLSRHPSRSSTSQRASRVEKPRSHHNSPRTIERRKTTTENKLYATLDDHFRMMFGMSPEESLEERPQPSRPVSWHPTSTQFQPSHPTNYCEPNQLDWSHEYSPSSRHSNHGSEFYSLSTRNSLYEPTPMLSCPSTTCEKHRGSDANWQSPQHRTWGYAQSPSNTPASEPLPWYLQQWAQRNHSQAMKKPDMMSIQAYPGQDEEREEDNGEKLVALGLYDTPEPSLTWDGPSAHMGKGLKLEETWQPPTNTEDEDEDVDDASSEASAEEPSPPLHPTHYRSQHMPMSVHVKSQTPGSMEGQSFFFDDDETVSKEWWFQQLKQPTMPVRGAGLGYGWL